MAPSPAPTCLRKRCDKRSGATPDPSSETETATCASSRAAASRMGDEDGACVAALAKRLLSTCTMRPSAITGGRSTGGATRTAWRPPPLRNVLRARSTKAATSEGSGATESVPDSMAPRVQQVADQPAHVPSLLDDDAVELAHLGRVQLRGHLQQRRRASSPSRRGRVARVVYVDERTVESGAMKPLPLLDRRPNRGQSHEPPTTRGGAPTSALPTAGSVPPPWTPGLTDPRRKNWPQKTAEYIMCVKGGIT